MSNVVKPPDANNRFNPGLILGILTALFVLAVPWWWNFFPDTANVIRFGAPTWVVSVVVGSFFISCFTAWALHQAWAALERDEDAVSVEGSADDTSRDATHPREETS